MGIISDKTLREPAPGSRLLASLDLPCGRFERIHAEAGAFRAEFDQHALIVSDRCPSGSMLHNGRRVRVRRDGGPVYSVLRPGDRIAGTLDTDITYEILILCPSYAEDFLRRELGPAAARLGSVIRAPLPKLARAIWQRLREALDPPVADVAGRATLCVELLLIKLIETQLQIVDTAGGSEKIDIIEKAAAFVDANVGERIDVRTIAEGVGLSPAYFSRLFHSALGVSVHRFVLDRRLLRARALLVETDLAISEISFATGFSSQSHLTTVFRHRFGTTPSQYRDAHAGKGGARRGNDPGDDA